MAKKRTGESSNIFGNDGNQKKPGDDEPIVDGLTSANAGVDEQVFGNPESAIAETDNSTNGNASTSSAGTGIDPEAPYGYTATGRIKRKYGPRGTRKETLPNYLGGFEGLLIAIHSGLAAVSHTPELELDEDEARKVAIAVDELARFYNIAPSQEVKVWMNFAGAIGAVYAPRAVAVIARKKHEREKAKTPKPNNVVDINAGFPPKEPAI